MKDFIQRTTDTDTMRMFMGDIYTISGAHPNSGDWLNLDIVALLKDIDAGGFDFINSKDQTGSWITSLIIDTLFNFEISSGSIQDADYEISDWRVIAYYNDIIVYLLTNQIMPIDNYINSKYTTDKLPKFVNEIIECKQQFKSRVTNGSKII